jgi:imidazolonepropionase-like amidohydrolase
MRTVILSSLLSTAALAGLALGGDPAGEAPATGDPVVEAPPPAGDPDPPSESAPAGVPAPEARPAPAEPAAAPEPAPLAADAWQIRAKTVYLGDGNRIEDGVVVVEGGKIRSVGRGVEVDPNAPLLEHDGVLTAGMVVGHSWFGVEGRNHDETRSLLPEARVANALLPDHSDFKKALAAGITSIVLAPTGQNVAGGQTCVVKTTGRMLERDAHLALSFSKDALSQGMQRVFFFFGSAEGETALDDGLEDSGGSANGSRAPTSYPGALAELDERIAAPEGAFAAARAGELQVLLEAWDRNEIARAASFAERHGLKGALRGAPLAGDLVERIKASGLGVVLGPFDPGQSQRSLQSAAVLAEAGVPIAFSLGASGTGTEGARFAAAMAVGHGLDPIAAWKGLSSDAARLASVGDRVGRIERGLDADLVLWSGDPIDLTSRVVAVFVDGKRIDINGDDE